MSANLLPSTLQQLSAILLFALSAIMVAVHSLLILRAAQQATLQRHTRVVAPIVAASFLAVWLGVAISMTAGVNLPLAPAQRLAVSLLVGFGPVLAAVALLFLSRTVSAVYVAMPSEWLIRVQTYRVAGLIFLYPFLYYGVIPAAFAVPAAVGDFLTGLLAPFVASAVAKHDSRGFAWAMAWNLFGILDLIVAPTTAVLSRAQVIGLYPLAIVPLFLGPPLGILTHIYSLRNLVVTRKVGSPARDEYLQAADCK
jgi:hypothetical protein